MPKMRNPRAILESNKTATAKRDLRGLAAEVKEGEINVDRVRKIRDIFQTRSAFLKKHPKTAGQLRRAYVIALTDLLNNHSKVQITQREFNELHTLANSLIYQKPVLEDLVLAYYGAWNAYDPAMKPEEVIIADNSEPKVKAPPTTEPIQPPVNHHAEAVRLLDEAKSIPDSPENLSEKKTKLLAVLNHLRKLKNHDNQTLDTLFTAGGLLAKKYPDDLGKNLLAIIIAEELNRFNGELAPNNAKHAGYVFTSLSNYALSEGRYTASEDYLLQAANFFAKTPGAKTKDAFLITHYKDILAVIANPVFNPTPEDLRQAIYATGELRKMLSKIDNPDLLREIENAAQILAKAPMLNDKSYSNANDKNALAVLAMFSAQLLLEVGKKEMAAKQLDKAEGNIIEAVNIFKHAKPTLDQNPKVKNAVENFTQGAKDAVRQLKTLKSPPKKPRVHFAEIENVLNHINSLENQTTAKLMSNLGNKTKTAWKAALKTPISPDKTKDKQPNPKLTTTPTQSPTENPAPKQVYPSQHRKR